MTGFFTAPRFAWGPGAIEQLSGLGARRAVLLVDPEVARSHADQRVAEELAKTDVVVERLESPSEPDRVEWAEELGDRIRAQGGDWIVAVGGGRTIDGAKAARLRAVRPGLSFSTFPVVADLPEPLAVRLVAIPTTSGSGSESSATADLWDRDGAPVEVSHRALTPDWALLDPGLAASLPTELVLDGALEAAAQAVEAYLSAWANPFSDALAIDALATVLDRLPHALRWSDDPDARAALHFAATEAGWAASNAQRGVAHALARALVGPTRLSYGRLLGVLLPYVLEFDRPSARERIETLTAAVSRGDSPTRLPLTTRFARLYESFRFPGSLAAVGVDTVALSRQRETVIARAMRSPAVLANPRVPSAQELGGLLDQVQGSTHSRP